MKIEHDCQITLSDLGVPAISGREISNIRLNRKCPECGQWWRVFISNEGASVAAWKTDIPSLKKWFWQRKQKKLLKAL